MYHSSNKHNFISSHVGNNDDTDKSENYMKTQQEILERQNKTLSNTNAFNNTGSNTISYSSHLNNQLLPNNILTN